jgi:hypothetical protein
MERHQRLSKKVLAKLIQDLEKDLGDYEPIAPTQWPPFQVLLPPRRLPARALYLTKGSVLIRWMTEGLLPGDSVVLCRPGLPTEAYLREAHRFLAKAKRAIFVGDLDPLDLHVYLALGHERAVHGGINDACLQLCERNLKKGRRLESIMFRMGAAEAHHFAILDSMVDIAAIVGRRCCDLLRAGWKLELEGATNADHFGPGHLQSLQREFLNPPQGRRRRI